MENCWIKQLYARVKVTVTSSTFELFEFKLAVGFLFYENNVPFRADIIYCDLVWSLSDVWEIPGWNFGWISSQVTQLEFWLGCLGFCRHSTDSLTLMTTRILKHLAQLTCHLTVNKTLSLSILNLYSDIHPYSYFSLFTMPLQLSLKRITVRPGVGDDLDIW